MSKFASLFLSENNENGTEGCAPTSLKEKAPTYAILFVDDEINVLKAMKRIFRRENYLLLTAQSGAQALSTLEKQPVHVVVSDHRMPGMTGAQLLTQIKCF